jgi:hypothetical protein
MKKNMLILAVISALMIVSCKKNLKESPAPAAPKATKVSQLKASESFNWKTSKYLVLNVSGLNTLTPISRTLIVSSTDGKEVYYQSRQLMSLSTSLPLIVPATSTELKITYGKIIKVISLNTPIIQFNYTNNN